MQMWKTLASALAVAGLLGFGGLSVGCEEEGPGEELGEAMDNAADDMNDAANNAGNNLEDAADNAGQRLENAGDRMENAAE